METSMGHFTAGGGTSSSSGGMEPSVSTPERAPLKPKTRLRTKTTVATPNSRRLQKATSAEKALENLPASPRLKQALRKTLSNYQQALAKENSEQRVSLPRPLHFDQYKDMRLPKVQEPVEEGALTSKTAGVLKAKPAAKTGLLKKRPATAHSGKAFGTTAKKAKTLSSGWTVVEVPKKPSGSYKEFFNPEGERFRTKTSAEEAGFVEE